MKTLIKIFLLIILFSIAKETSATHNRAGEITFVQTGPLTVKATITLYTKTSSVAADRDSIEIFWGDGSSQFLVRSNGWGDPQPNDVKISYYTGSHTFPARGTYTMSMFDPNRITSILNVNFPDSGSVPFYLETTFTFLNTQFQGENNSVVLLQAPIDVGCINEIFKHNPNAYDIDGDSISYELVVPLMAQGTNVPDYKMPDAINPGANNKFSFDTKTGDLYWDSPQVAGEYNVAFRVNEYRDGQLITSIVRDMQILINNNCDSKPPILTIPENVCLIAGDTLRVNIKADDIDFGQKVLINASGEPFESEFGKATLENENVFVNPPASSLFTWITTCEHVNKPYYQLLFKAMDNTFSDTSGLVDLKIFKVKVSGAPPQNLEAKTVNSIIKLTWDYPYPCINSENEYFKGFSVWRKENPNSFEIDTCTPGLEGKGYKIIEYLTDNNDAISYFYEDNNVEKGKVYCYRVLAEYAHNTYNGFPYNPVQSLASNESCEIIPDDEPVITKTSVLKTDRINGEIEINWIKPDISVFDTVSYPPPYKYHLLRTEGLNNTNYNYIQGADFVFNSYYIMDTIRFIDTDLNTIDKQYVYKVEFTSDGSFHSNSKPSSSIFLKLEGLDKKINLDFNITTPWNNYKYNFYRKNNISGLFELIGTNSSGQYTDINLNNGEEYCYYTKSFGKIGSNNFVIINDSQINCTIPQDKEAPCPPNLVVKNNCSENTNIEEDIYNHLSWTNPNNTCQYTDDVVKYEIYYSELQDGDYSLLYTISDSDVTDTTHLALESAGCYYIVAIDNNGNKSEESAIVCAENCPLYILPNTFTPNNDNENDLFIPILKRHINKVNFKVFNQWGELIFETEDPNINWKGNTFSGKIISSGTYYYLCQPFSNNERLKLMKGFIEVIY